MKITTVRTRSVLALLAGLAVLGVGPAVAAGTTPSNDHPTGSQISHSKRLAQIRTATALFHNIAAAEDAGYVQFKDKDGVSCIDMPGMGGMGVHFVNPKLIADPAIDPARPEALVFAPDRDGTLRLAALEYLVDKKAWDAKHAYGPQLFRHHPFDITTAPNRYNLPTFYSQHVWAWKANPSGPLNMWNPKVKCPV